ncbi:MAG: YihY/virulence factor BrkB family protein [Bacteroidales bacterium]|nr:YihY/virulence factor BrkB family protein [Bacteroidales bacterium]
MEKNPNSPYSKRMDRKKIKLASGQLLTDKIWTLDLSGFSTAKRYLYKLVKLIRIVFYDFSDKRMNFQCNALSYFCALSLIPLLAIIFGVTGGLGLSDRISGLLYRLLPNNPDLVNMLVEKSTDIIDIAQSGPVGWVSAVMLLWTVLWMMFQVERVFNNVWSIKKIPRKLYRRFSMYFLTILLLPFVLVIFGFGIATYSNVFTLLGMDRISEIRVLYKILGWLALYAVTVLTLSAMYKFIPAADVRYRNALIAALFSGAVFVIFQFLYLQTQMFVTRLNAVYGAIAAVPLFLMWLNFSWQIVIYGAQLSFAIQNVDTYNLPNDITFMDAFGADKERRRRRKEERES